MHIIVYSRAAIELATLPDEPHIVISISTPGDAPAKVPARECTLGILRLAFDDADRVVPIFPSTLIDGGCTADRECVLFSDEMGGKVADFVSDFARDTVVIVHCDAGRSRSVGVAAALAKQHDGDDAYWFKHYSPNRLVYRKVLDAFETTA